MFAYNTTSHTITNYIPFELPYGHQATLPTALSLSLKPTYTYELRERIKTEIKSYTTSGTH